MTPARIQPPQDLDSEQATLGAMLCEREAALLAIGSLTTADFYHEPHRKLFAVIAELAAAGPLDIVTVTSALNERNQLAEVGGQSYLVELQDAAPTAAMVQRYAENVRRTAIRRRRWLAALRFSGNPEDVEAEIALTEAFAQQPERAPALRVIELCDFLADTTPPPPDVIEGVSKAGTILGMFGPAESGKSHLGIDLCLTVAAGGDWLGRFPTTKGSAVYCEQERAEFLVRDKIRELVKGAYHPDDAAPFFVFPMQSLKLDTPEAQEAFRQQIVDLGPRLVVIDTAIAVAGTVQFLDPGQVRPWMEFWRRLAVEIAGVVCLICHVPKWVGKEPTLAALFGTEDFGASLDYALATMPIDPGKHVFRLTCVKNTWGVDRPDLTFEIMSNPDGGIVLAASAPVYGGVRTLIMENMSDEWTGGAAFARLIENAGFSPRAARKTLDGLVADGLVEHQPDPKNRRWHQFRLPAEGGV